ncbi:MAG: Uncharacterized protein FD161_1012 [Limisphaerales bacterium]|nr:MAG: Uncharacterized protein FD161_1012 [Limisphaerales bacterium]KAG0509795.1 MAG: Uncharacterized protein E1N63_1012 [Limisphaerales bacterium]TXT50983.1 MAG: Uncharacterized protein FD140_2045 [Limisphaerales bacterium]
MTAAPEQCTASVPPSAQLAGQLAAVRSKKTGVEAGSGVALLLGGLTLALGIGMVLDWFLDFPWAIRFLIFVSYLAAAGHIIWHSILIPILRQPDDDDVALLVERGHPQFATRLIAALQLTRPGALQTGEAPSLVRELVAQTERIARPLDFTDVISTHQFRRLVGWAVVIVGIGGVVFWKGGEVSRDLLHRAFLSREIEVPRKTRIGQTSGDLRIARGDNVTLFAIAKGVVPDRAKLVLKFASGRTQEFLLEPGKESKARFEQALENVQDSFDYTFHIGDGKSRSARVEAVERPGIAKLDALQVYPEYTGLGTVRRSLGDLTLLVGSKLNLTLTPTKEVAKGAVLVTSTTNAQPLTLPLAVNPKNAREVQVSIPITSESLSGFSIHLEDKFGFRSKDDAVYRLEVLPDKAPVVRITYPERKEELITQKATILIGFEAVDDFAVKQLFLRYTVDGGEEKGIELTLEAAQRGLRRRYDWKVGALNPKVAEGAMLEYWIEARDNNNVTGPGIGASEHFSAKVVSDAEKRADLLNRVGDSIGAIGEAANDQEKLNQRLGDIIQGRPERP